MDINKLPIRKLQIESSLALEILKNADNNSLWTVNKKVDHDSTLFYGQVLTIFMEKYGKLPSETEMGKKIKLIDPE